MFVQTSQIPEKFAETWLLSLTYHFATHSLCFFIPIFTKNFRMISKKNIGCDGLITFWKKPRYLSFKSSLQPIITWLLKFFGNKIIISKWGKKLFQSGAPSTIFYFKVWQALFQKGAETVISKWLKVYFKVEQFFQSGANVISKWGSYFKVG